MSNMKDIAATFGDLADGREPTTADLVMARDYLSHLIDVRNHDAALPFFRRGQDGTVHVCKSTPSGGQRPLCGRTGWGPSQDTPGPATCAGCLSVLESTDNTGQEN